MKTIQELIESKVRFNNTNRGGWRLVTCPVCGDYKPRAGFKFDNQGENAVYHCFNNATCGGAYCPAETNGFMSKNMKNVLIAIGCSEMEIKELIFEYARIYNNTTSSGVQVKREFVPSAIDLPSFFVPIDIMSDELQHLLAFDYIEKRGLDPLAYPYMVCDTRYPHSTINLWKDRLIIPAFYKNEVIWYQGRDMTDTKSKKYLNCNAPGSKVLYNYDHLFDHEGDKIFIFEGFFDAMSVFPFCSVSCQSSNLTNEQIQALNTSKKQKIIIPDIDKNGMELATQGLEQGWSISFPKLRGLSDINKFCSKYGKLAATYEILSNIQYGDSAQIYIQMIKNNLYF